MDHITQQKLLEIGRSLVWSCVERRDFSGLNKYISDVNSENDKRRDASRMVIAGAGSECTVINNSAMRAGVLFSVPLPTIEEAEYLFSFNFEKAVELVGRSLLATACLVIQAPTVRISRSAPKDAQGADRASSAPVSPATQSAMPLEVRIVSMPGRVTETSIERDEDGNILSSAQLERDVA